MNLIISKKIQSSFMGWIFFLITTSATYALSLFAAISPYCYGIENLYVHQE